MSSMTTARYCAAKEVFWSRAGPAGSEERAAKGRGWRRGKLNCDVGLAEKQPISRQAGGEMWVPGTHV